MQAFLFTLVALFYARMANATSRNFTDEELVDDALRFTTKRDWRNASAQAAKAGGHHAFRCAYARGREFFTQCTAHMDRASPTGRVWEDYKYTNEDLVESAKAHKHIIDWKRCSKAAYQAARRRYRLRPGWKEQWWNKIIGHMADWNEKAYQVYAYEFSDNTVYVGLTCAPERRHSAVDGHGIKGPVYKHGKATGLVPKLVVVAQDLSGKAAGELESATIDKYRSSNWTLLNNNTGGSLGKIHYKWSNDELLARAKLHATRSAWLTADQYGYKQAKKRGIFEQCVAHMPGEHELSTARCKGPRQPVSEETRRRQSEAARARFHQGRCAADEDAVLKNSMKTIILVGGQPVTHAVALAAELATERGGKFITPDSTANWLRVNNTIQEGKDGDVFVVTSAVPGRTIRRYLEAGYKVELVDAGVAQSANPGSINNYNCSVREAKRELGILPKKAAAVEKAAIVVAEPVEFKLVDVTEQVFAELSKVGITSLPNRLKARVAYSVDLKQSQPVESVLAMLTMCGRAQPVVVTVGGVSCLFKLSADELLAEVRKITEALS